MPPKKQKGQKMAIQDFLLTDQFGATGGGSWADEVEDEINITSDSQLQAFRKPGTGSDRPAWGSGGDRGGRDDRYGPRPIPDSPPYKAHVSGLPSEMMDDELKDAITDAFNECQIEDISIITTKAEIKFAFITFVTRKDLEKVAGDAPMPIFLNDRKLSVQVADRREERRPRQEARDLDWSVKRSLPPAENRPERRNNFEFVDRRGQQDFNAPRGPPSELGSERGGPNHDRRGPRPEPPPARELDWSQKRGPLSPLPQAERPPSRSGSRPRGSGVPMDSRSSSHRGGGGDRRASPAQWGEPRQEGSRPPRREFSREERPPRAPTAAEMDSQWRRGMRPDNVQSPDRSRDGSEAPPSPAGATPPAARPGGRPVLNLSKRTVSDAPDVVSPTPSTSDPKSNPFGAARPIDTRARELEIEQKREQARKEAEEKKKQEEERLAKEQEAAAEEAAKQAEAEAAKANSEAEEQVEEVAKPEVLAKEGASSPKAAPTAAGGERRGGPRPRGDHREGSHQKPSRATDSGNWRQASGEQRGQRGTPAGPRRGGGGPGRGNRFDNARSPRSNGGPAPHGENQPPPQQTSEPPTPTPEDDGWTTVPNKRRSVRQAPGTQ